MEMFKGSDAKCVRGRLELIAKFPQQIRVLKRTPEIALLDFKCSGLHNRFSDWKRTAELRKYLRMVFNDERAALDIALKQSATNSFFENLNGLFENHRESVAARIRRYPADELNRFRRGEVVSPAFVQSMVPDILLETREIFRVTNRETTLPNGPIIFSFQFRYAVCIYVLVLKWAIDSGYQTVSTTKIRNDFLDAMYAAYGTFFDGVITEDKKLSEVYWGAKWLLKNLFSIG